MRLRWSFAREPEPRTADALAIRPGPGKQNDTRSLATSVLEHGPTVFGTPAKPVRILVLPHDPTFDDMLAATFVELQLANLPIPAGAAAFAQLATLVREGLMPSTVPLEESIEGIYLAIRNLAGNDLADPGIATAFVDRWRAMAAVLLEAAANSMDPFSSRLFHARPEFARERTFLRDDRRVYEQDLRRADRLLVRIPGRLGPDAALILRDPKCLLFTHWAREDPDAPLGHGYLLLAVARGGGEWIFSTHPIHRTPINSLATLLQAEEARLDPVSADSDPWFDGACFQHSLVAAPKRGSRLSDHLVLATFRKWAKARPVRRRRIPWAAVAAGASLVAAVAGAWAWHSIVPKVVDFEARGSMLPDEVIPDLRSEGLKIGRFALIIGVGKSSLGSLPAAVPDSVRFYRLLTEKFDYSPANVKLLVDDPSLALDGSGRVISGVRTPTLSNVRAALSELSFASERYPAGDTSQFLLYYGGHGHIEERAKQVGYLVLSDCWEHRVPWVPDEYCYNMSHLRLDVENQIRTTHKMLLVDSCFSGFTVKTRGEYQANPSAVYQLWREKAFTVLTATSESQRAREQDGESYFAGAVMRGLGFGIPGLPADANRDLIVTEAELAAWVKRDVEERARNAPHQDPQYVRGMEGDGVGQFLFFSGGSAPSAPSGSP